MNLHAAFVLCCGESDPILRRGREQCSVATVLELSVEVVKQVTHKLMGVLLLIAPGHTNTALNHTTEITHKDYAGLKRKQVTAHYSEFNSGKNPC